MRRTAITNRIERRAPARYVSRMNAVILSVGDELVTGQTLDTNAAWLAAELTRAGLDVLRHVTVGDDLERLTVSIRHALAAAEVVVVTGGLGPTADDLTRQALADAVGQSLEENSEALAQIVAFFERWQRPMAESNRIQALIPRGCHVIPNPRGTAPGIHYHHDAGHLFALPGVPGEMKAMFAESVAPAIAVTGRATVLVGRLNTFGMSEAKLGEAIADLMARGRNPLVGTTASQAVISVRIIARAPSEAEARSLLEADKDEVRRRLGTSVFGEEDDTLQAATARLLLERGPTIATAESCTGGLLANRLTDMPGSSAYFQRGYVTYSNASKLEMLGVPHEMLESQGAVSAAAAEAMARNCRTSAATDLALSITGIAGPGGGSADKPVGLVFVALAEPKSVQSRRLLLGTHLTREEIRDRACKSALNLLRLHLLEHT